MNRLLPLREEKGDFLKASEWLKTNMGKEEIAGVFDPRIGFYSEKKYKIISENRTIPKKIHYLVKIFDKNTTPEKHWVKKEVFSDFGNEIVIYKKE